MPPIIFPIAGILATLGAVAVARVLAREWRRVNAELDRMAHGRGETSAPLPKLRRDPVSGLYRPE